MHGHLRMLTFTNYYIGNNTGSHSKAAATGACVAPRRRFPWYDHSGAAFVSGARLGDC